MDEQLRDVADYLGGLPDDRREAMTQLRNLILDHLPDGYTETFDGMLNFVVPLDRYPQTYNKKPLVYAALASQKNHMSLYLMGIYSDPDAGRWLADGFRAAGKRLDMGKSCVRFKQLDDLPLDLIAEAIGRTPVDDYIARYEASRRR